MGRIVLQDELTKCEICGQYKGIVKNFQTPYETIDVDVLCVCDGVLCKICKKNKVRRPISNYFDQVSQTIWHVPSFSRLICSDCQTIEAIKEKRRIKKRRKEIAIEVSRLATSINAKFIGVWARDYLNIYILESQLVGYGLAYARYVESKWKFGNQTVTSLTHLEQIILGVDPPENEILSVADWIKKEKS